VTGQVTYNFSDSVVIVTGAARGIGRAIVHAFVRAGAFVVAADRDADGLAETCSFQGGAPAAVHADISTSEGANAIVDAALERYGRLDICVNNAAVAPHTALLEERVEVWDTVYAVNCRGTFLMTQAAARAMISGDNGDRSGGRIINFSSAASRRGSPGTAAYASSRAAIESFSRVAAIELAPHNILVNTISPGLIDTQPKPLPLSMAGALSKRIPTLPLARPGQPDEVVSVVLFLASEEASNINGTVISVDGAASVGTRFGGTVVDDDVRYDWVTDRQRE
jgi:NAD(P)-dependent dehydrogenase (short-subunit alcohol dehydrogenase family)